jgi:hypothetical protein
MHECLLGVCFVSFPAIESNDDCAEEGEVFEYQEEGDQGQAQQGKPSTCAYLNPIISLCIALLLFLLQCIVYVHCYAPCVAIVVDLAPQVELLSSIRMTPLTPTPYSEK